MSLPLQASLIHDSDSPNLPQNLPRHVAFICDGNSRWAKVRNLPTSAGHVRGADRLVEVLEFLKEAKIEYCTLYGFSTENWARPRQEILDIFNVMEQTARKFYQRALQEGVGVKILGNIHDERVPHGLKDILEQLEKDTEKQDPYLTVCIAVNYSGRQDLVNASRQIAERVLRGEIESADISEDILSSMMYTSDIPDPDLIIRTSGECRLSNFLLWESAYAEIYFTPIYWPDFSKIAWYDALAWYDQRRRSFGGRIETTAEHHYL
jgi:undecaprenyl diphosphate synthase